MTRSFKDSKTHIKTLIVTGGKVDLQLINEINCNQFSFIIAVDSGANSLYEANIIPNTLLGDFDSINSEILEYYKSKQVDIMNFPSHKDKTDTEIALDYVMELGTTELYILGGFGTRMDHTLSNLFIIEKYTEKINCKLIDLHNLVQFIKGPQKLTFDKSKYKYVSIIPLSNEITGVTTYGLKYPLNQATLKRTDSIGISNEIIKDKGAFSISEGKALIIQSKD